MAAPFSALREHLSDGFAAVPDHVRRELMLVLGAVVVLTIGVGLLLGFS
jgi:hypothetical protein